MFQQSISKSKEETLGKLIKIYVAQTLLDKGVQSIQEQGLNLLTEFLVKMIRTVGATAQKIYELQGRQEANIFHVMLSLDHMRVKPNEILSHLASESRVVSEQTAVTLRKDQGSEAIQLNRMLSSLMEQIFREKYGQPEEEYQNNIRTTKNIIKIEHMLPEQFLKPIQQKSIEECIAVPQYFRDDVASKEKKEITEKELKETKKQFILKAEEDNFNKQKQRLINLNRNQRSLENGQGESFDRQANHFNVPVKKVRTLDEIDKLMK